MFWNSKKAKKPESQDIRDDQHDTELSETEAERKRKLQEIDEQITIVLPIIRGK